MTVLSNCSSHRGNVFTENSLFFCVSFDHLTLQAVYEENNYTVPFYSCPFVGLYIFYRAGQKDKSLTSLYIFSNFCIMTCIKTRTLPFLHLLYIHFILASTSPEANLFF